MAFTAQEVELLTRSLSKDRLHKYYTKSNNYQQSIVLHQLALNIASGLAPMIALVELSLRNEICFHFDRLFGCKDWLLKQPTGFIWKGEEESSIKRAKNGAQRAAYSKMQNPAKQALDAVAFPSGFPKGLSHEDRVKKRQREITVTQGQVVAQLTMFFWKRLFSADYEPTLWKRELKRVFPNKTLSRGVVAEHLEVIYQARNRLAHHEPVIDERLQAVLNSIDFVAQNFQSRQPRLDTPLGKLTTPYRVELDRAIIAFKTAWDPLDL